jgi:acyl carrier protein
MTLHGEFMSSIEEKVKSLVASRLGVEESAVVGKAKFIEDLGANSLDMVELVMAIEEAFGIDIADEESEGIRTVDDAINFVKTAQV